MIDVTGLQPDDAVSDVDHARRNAVRADAVDDGAVARLPQEAPKPLRGSYKDRVVKSVEIPGVEQELVGPAEAFGEAEGHERVGDVEVPGYGEAGGHGKRRQEHHHDRHLAMRLSVCHERAAPELGLIRADEEMHEDRAGEQ